MSPGDALREWHGKEKEASKACVFMCATQQVMLGSWGNPINSASFPRTDGFGGMGNREDPGKLGGRVVNVKCMHGSVLARKCEEETGLSTSIPSLSRENTVSGSPKWRPRFLLELLRSPGLWVSTCCWWG